MISISLQRILHLSLSLVVLAQGIHHMAFAQESSDSGLYLKQVTKAARSRVRPGSICTLQATIGNSGSELGQAELLATVDGDATSQWCRTVSCEAGEQCELEIYLRIPQQPRDAKAVRIQIQLTANQDGREIVLQHQGKPVIDSLRLLIDPPKVVAASALPEDPLQPPDWFWPQPATVMNASYQLAVAALIDSGNPRYMSNFGLLGMPLNEADWEAVDLLIISEPRIFEEPASLESARRYLESGGRVWVMLDELDCEALTYLLESHQYCRQVDELELNHFTVELHDSNLPLSEADRTVTIEEAVRLKRVLQKGGRVTHSIGGWPAVITWDVGYGELSVTPLSAAGWMEPRLKQTDRDPVYQSEYKTRAWATPLAADLASGRHYRPLQSDVIYPLEHIGTPVVTRAWVALLLSSFCGCLVVVGLWLGFSGRRAQLGVAFPALAILFGLFFCWARSRVQSDIEECVAKLQLVEVSENGQLAHVTEQAAVFLDAVADMNLSYDNDGWASPGTSNASGINRFTLQDFQDWRLSNKDWPPGVWRYQAEYFADADDLLVNAHLDSEGCQLSLPAPLLGQLTDAIIGFVPGDPMLCTPTAKGMKAISDIPIGDSRWIAGTILSAEQRRRIDVYGELFDPEKRDRIRRRMLYGWTNLWPAPSWDRPIPLKGSALTAVPVRLHAPEIGQKVYIPHGLIKLRQSPTQGGKSTAYSDSLGRWRSDLTMAIDRQFEFLLPEEVLPFEISQVDLQLDIRAPHRTVTIALHDGKQWQTLTELNGPSIPWQTRVLDKNILSAAHPEGRLRVRIQVSERTDMAPGASVSNVVAWEIEHFHASLSGSRLP